MSSVTQNAGNLKTNKDNGPSLRIDQEFENLSEDNRSYASSIEGFEEEELKQYKYAGNPYDFFTARKANKFFKEDLFDIKRASLDRKFILQKNEGTIKRDLPRIEQDIEEAKELQE